MYETIEAAIKDNEAIGCAHAPNALGFLKMPEGFALMIDPDRMFYFYTGIHGESVNHWNKWAVYKWAKAESKKA